MLPLSRVVLPSLAVESTKASPPRRNKSEHAAERTRNPPGQARQRLTAAHLLVQVDEVLRDAVDVRRLDLEQLRDRHGADGPRAPGPRTEPQSRCCGGLRIALLHGIRKSADGSSDGVSGSDSFLRSTKPPLTALLALTLALLSSAGAMRSETAQIMCNAASGLRSRKHFGRMQPLRSVPTPPAVLLK